MIPKEITKYRSEQEVAKAAELKAKLDMVELRDKPKYGRHPRKIGELVCDTGVKTGYRNATAKFTLRLDDDLFIAEHGDFWYVSASRSALQAKMNEVARVTLDLEWTRYLLIKYSATVPYRDSWRSTTTLGVDRQDTSVVKEILGIELDWEVVEYSDAIHLPGDDGERYMKRDVDDDGNASTAQETVSELPAGLVPYTKEREDLLQQFRAAFRTIDSRMFELLRGSPSEVAGKLDAVGGSHLLAAPPTEPKKSKKKS